MRSVCGTSISVAAAIRIRSIRLLMRWVTLVVISGSTSRKIALRMAASSFTRPFGVKKAPSAYARRCCAMNSRQNSISLIRDPLNQEGQFGLGDGMGGDTSFVVRVKGEGLR